MKSKQRESITGGRDVFVSLPTGIMENQFATKIIPESGNLAFDMLVQPF